MTITVWFGFTKTHSACNTALWQEIEEHTWHEIKFLKWKTGQGLDDCSQMCETASSHSNKALSCVHRVTQHSTKTRFNCSNVPSGCLLTDLLITMLKYMSNPKGPKAIKQECNPNPNLHYTADNSWLICLPVKLFLMSIIWMSIKCSIYLQVDNFIWWVS